MPQDIPLVSRARGALLGLACGDAVGTAVELRPRDSFEPLADMLGGGPFELAPGQWTDDTSMALCLAESLLECGGFDARDQMQRYLRWWRDGHLSATGRCFDIGATVREALEVFAEIGTPFAGSTHPRSAGKGSLMRLAPVVLRFHPDRDAVDRHAAESSRTTHGAAEAVACCRILGGVLSALLDGVPRELAIAAVPPASWMSPRLQRVAAGAWRESSRDEIRGTGYAVDCLEAALWCFFHSNGFEPAVLAAANLGEDAGSTAAVCGQLAGAWFGEAAIPSRWLERLSLRDQIADWAERLVGAGTEA